VADLKSVVAENCPIDLAVGIGELGKGREGWRRTHFQAAAALSIARRTTRNVARYAEHVLTASIQHNDLLVGSLHELYLAPLGAEPDGGELHLTTLRAYFGARRNSSSAAEALGVNRRTISNRLRAIEARLECPLDGIWAELETALRLFDLGVYESNSSRGLRIAGDDSRTQEAAAPLPT